MLTVRQLLVVSGQNSTGVMHANQLAREFPGRPYSIARVAAAYEGQRRLYFISLMSVNLLLSNEIRDLSDLTQRLPDPRGRMSSSEVQTLAAELETHGVLLRFVDADLQRAALAGTVAALARVPVIVVNAENLTHIRDVTTGLIAIGGGAAALGGGIIALAGAPAEAPVVLLLIGGILISFGSGLAIGAGTRLLDEGVPPTTSTPSPDQTETEISPAVPPDEGSQNEQNAIELPNAVAIGDSPPGLDIDGVVTDLGDLALNWLLSDFLPEGWDSDAGVGVPSFGGSGPDPEDGGGTGGGFEIPFS